MGMKYAYDEEGLTFYYFILTVLGIYVMPATFSLLWPASKNSKHINGCNCQKCKDNRTRIGLLARKSASKLVCIKYAVLVVAWIGFIFSIQQVYIKKTTTAKIYDPFEVLGISPGASEKTIKRAYKVMSLKWHPDKAKDEKAKEAANIKFIEISKAYKTLTDKVARKNWEEYGNPDGPQTFSLGIALPSWLVDSKNQIFVLALYIMGFGLVVPYLVSRSWSGSKKYTRDKLLHSTMGMFYQEMKDGMSVKKILDLIANAFEFREEFKWVTPIGAEETKVLVDYIVSQGDKVTGDRFDSMKKFNSDFALRASALLYAHFYRVELEREDWRQDQAKVVLQAAHLSMGLLRISLVRGWVVTGLNSITISQFLIQACWECHSPLIQLPELLSSDVKGLRTKKRVIKSIRDFLEIEDAERREFLSRFTDQQYENICNVARNYPDLSVEEVSFKILGQEEITPGGIITCVVKLKLMTLEEAIAKGKSSKVNLKPSDQESNKGEDIEQFEFDEDGNMIESSKNLLGSPRNTDAKVGVHVPVHAPFYPAEKKPLWWVILLNSKMNSFVCDPVKVLDLIDSKTITLQLPAPSKPGLVQLNLMVRSDCLFGADTLMEVKFSVVKESSSNTKPDSDWDITESESDSATPFGNDQ